MSIMIRVKEVDKERNAIQYTSHSSASYEFKIIERETTAEDCH